ASDLDYFGSSVAIAGKSVIAGAYFDDPGVTNAGSVYLYDLNSPTPDLPTTNLNNITPASFDDFGFAVAASGKYVVVGSPYEDQGAENAGAAYVFDLSSKSPTTPAMILYNPNPATGDSFGNSVAISGNLVFVGAEAADGGAFNSGLAYVYDLSSNTPTA